MGGNKQKFEALVPKADAGTFFSNLGQGLTDGTLNLNGTTLELDAFESFKISLKDFGESWLIKVKVKYPKYVRQAPVGASIGSEKPTAGPCETPEGAPCQKLPGKPKYKGLKKRMKKPWKDILAMLNAGTMPPANMLSAFIADSELMISYPDEGEEFYAPYHAELKRFAAAVEADDVTQTLAAAMELDRIKKECHAKYK